MATLYLLLLLFIMCTIYYNCIIIFLAQEDILMIRAQPNTEADIKFRVSLSQKKADGQQIEC